MASTRHPYRSVQVSGGSTQGYMTFDLRVKVPRPDRGDGAGGAGGGGGGGGRTSSFNAVERAWAWLSVGRLLRRALESTNETVKALTIRAATQLSVQVGIRTCNITMLFVLFLKSFFHPDISN